MFQIGHVSLTSADTYRRDSYCFPRVFQNLPAPPKQYDVFCDFQSFFQLENLGSHLEMRPDDRFLPQGKQILPEICQVRPMPYPNTSTTGTPSSKYEHRRASALLRDIQNIRIGMGKKPIVSVTYENERISIKNSLPYLKCVYVNGFLSI